MVGKLNAEEREILKNATVEGMAENEAYIDALRRKFYRLRPETREAVLRDLGTINPPSERFYGTAGLLIDGYGRAERWWNRIILRMAENGEP